MQNNENNQTRELAIIAAETYLQAKQKKLPSTIIYLLKNT